MIRAVETKDHGAIDHLIEVAFGGRDEVNLVEGLRKNGDMALEQVAEFEGQVVGHIAYSKLVEPDGSLALAPLAVEPGHQKQGIGSALVKHSMSDLSKGDWTSVFVLGDPNYYTRFGFSVDVARGCSSPYAGPHLMAFELVDGAVASENKTVIHPPAFEAV